jgi:hypothetical protein
MAEVTYVPEVECTVIVPNGIMDSQVVKVIDTDNLGHMLRVAKGSLVEKDGRKYLPVGLVTLDRERRRALVELPQEADSGTRRVWVALSRFRRQESGG